jgi:hypothetical protein
MKKIMSRMAKPVMKMEGETDKLVKNTRIVIERKRIVSKHD